MATEKQREAVIRLLYQVESVSKYFDDVAYPRKSREELQWFVDEVEEAFGITPDESPSKPKLPLEYE